MEPIIRIRDLHYAYNEQKMALNGIDLDIYPGEKIAVIGSNGAGKSTFFLNLNGVLSPESGEIRYKDTLITKKNLNDLLDSIFPHFGNIVTVALVYWGLTKPKMTSGKMVLIVLIISCDRTHTRHHRTCPRGRATSDTEG